MFSFIRNYQIFLPGFGVISVMDFDHSNRCVVVSDCCFNLYFSDK